MENGSETEISVLMASFEAHPFIKVGGLGDVVGSLPRHLRERGVDARVIVPLMSCIPDEYVKRMIRVCSLRTAFSVQRRFTVLTLDHGDVTFYFIDCKDLYCRENVYSYDDDGERMGFFCKAVIEFIGHSDYRPDIIHCHDWHTGLLPMFIRWSGDDRIRGIRSVLTLHNVLYSGGCGPEVLEHFPGLSDMMDGNPVLRDFLMMDGKFDYLYAGMVFSDAVTTVSPTHAKEIMTLYKEGAVGKILDGTGKRIRGIVNGIDMDIFNPRSDTDLRNNFDTATIRLRDRNKLDFQEEMGLEKGTDRFLAVYSGRIAEQKGIDRIADAAPGLLAAGIQLVVMGSGEGEALDRLAALAESNRGRMAVFPSYVRGKQHRQFSAADIIMMPSLYEPCGLVQMIAMRYGAVPVCRRTGGLADTVSDYKGGLDPGADGFLYRGDDGASLMDAVIAAYRVWHMKHSDWRMMQVNGMMRDSGWGPSARQYVLLYRETVGMLHSVFHDSRDPVYRSPPGAVPLSAEVTVRIRAPSCDSVGLRIFDGETAVIPMRRKGEMFEASVRMPPDPATVEYDFIILKGEQTRYYGNNSRRLGGVGQMEVFDPERYRITVYRECPVPRWFREAVIYQIYPDSFFRGSDWEERAASLGDGRWAPQHSNAAADSWEEEPAFIVDGRGNVMDWRFHCGTLQGVEEKIPYLESLGFTAIYLTPVFLAPSVHRYDTADYMTVDPLLGGNGSLRDLTAACGGRGIRVILDGVFNHTGWDSIYFDRYGRFGGGAYGNPSSEYQEWFAFLDGSCRNYDCWHGDLSLPRISPRSEGFRRFVCGPGGVFDRWTSMGVAGWRLDQAECLGDAFLEAFHGKVAQAGGVQIGETIYDASLITVGKRERNMLADGTLESTTSYPVRQAILGFADGTVSSSEAAERILSLRENYPPEQFYSMTLFLGCHDTPRAISVLEEAGGGRTMGLYRAALAMMFSLPGVPMVYYGDEAGLGGTDDPLNRRPFPWGREDREVTEMYRDLISVYRGHRALVYGDLAIECPSGDVLVIRREWEDEAVVTVVNRGPSPYGTGFGKEYEPLFPRGATSEVAGPGAAVFRTGVRKG